MTSESSSANYPSRDPQLFYELARDRLAAQLNFIDALDNKIGMLLSLATGLVALLAAVFALRATPFGAAEYTTLSISALVYVLVSACGMNAYRAQTWHFGPDLDHVWSRLWSKDDDQLAQWKTANDFRDYFERNLQGQNAKEVALRRVLGGVVIQTLLLVLALSLVAAGV